MLTLAEIQAAVLREANGLPITRANHVHLADRVVPPSDFPLATARAVELPEWSVYDESGLMQTPDWLDLACHHAAVNQVKHAAARVLQCHDPAHNEMKLVATLDGSSARWECCVCGYRYGRDQPSTPTLVDA